MTTNSKCIATTRCRFATSFEELHGIGTAVVLYSGGVDSTHAVFKLAKMGIRVVAFHAIIGSKDTEHSRRVSRNAKKFGAEFVEHDLRKKFADDYISPAIRSDARYFGVFPVCSSLSRPLIAEAGVRLAESCSADALVHCSTWVQNSGARFNRTIHACNPNLVIATPYASNSIDREEKCSELVSNGISVSEASIFSVDANLWGRVIEAGELDDPANPIPEGVFQWTRSEIDTVPEIVVDMRFENGVPIALDGKNMELLDLIEFLNIEGGRRAIGRFNGLEDTPVEFGGIKNHEVREAPAADVIFRAREQLVLATLTQRENCAMAHACSEWTRLVVNGHWKSPLREANQLLIGRLSKLVNGNVRMVLKQNMAFPLSIKSESSPSYWNVRKDFEKSLQKIEVSALLEMATSTERLRSKTPQIR